VLNRIRAIWARIWRRRGQPPSGDRGFNDQDAARSYRNQKDIEAARGDWCGWPGGP
jgi:hypothetical protein